jgi:ketosteroid isomerase-like protein
MNAEENKKLVMQGYEMFASKDIQGIVDMCADDVELSSGEIENVPFSGSFRGKAGVAEFFTKLGQSVDIRLFRPDTVVAENDTVVVCGTSQAEVRATGRAYDDRWVHVFTLRDGKTARMEQHHDSATIQAAFKPTITPSSMQADVPLRH